VNCSFILNENVEWNETVANGILIEGKCLTGYKGLSIRACIQIDSNATWGDSSGTCHGT